MIELAKRLPKTLSKSFLDLESEALSSINVKPASLHTK